MQRDARALERGEPGIEPFAGRKLRMRALFHDCAVFHHHDPVRRAHGGEAVRDDKRGALSARSASLLARVGVVSEHWVDTVTTFHEGFSNMVGQTHHIDAQCKRLGLEKTKGVGFARKAFAKAS